MQHSPLKKLLQTGAAVLVLSAWAGWQFYPTQSRASDEHGHEHDHDEDGEHSEGQLALDAEQIAAAGIEMAVAAPGTVSREVIVPGRIVTAADRMAQIVAKVSGTVTEARKNLGDSVKRGEVVALIESREMAEAVAEYLAAKRAGELARVTFDREQGLWNKKVIPQQEYLNAKREFQEISIRLDLARQKLRALGHEGEVDEKADARFYEVKSPLAGRVIQRELTLGEYVDTAHAAYVIADLGVLWVETAIAPDDLPYVREGQPVRITGGDAKGQGTLIFVSPVIDPETRSAKAIVELDNAAGTWRPGEFASAAIATAANGASVVVPRDAVQKIEGSPVVFVRNGAGFEKRAVTLGREDSRNVEIISGLTAGETIAVTGAFTLKAELGKAEAGHEH